MNDEKDKTDASDGNDDANDGPPKQDDSTRSAGGGILDTVGKVIGLVDKGATALQKVTKAVRDAGAALKTKTDPARDESAKKWLLSVADFIESIVALIQESKPLPEGSSRRIEAQQERVARELKDSTYAIHVTSCTEELEKVADSVERVPHLRSEQSLTAEANKLQEVAQHFRGLAT